MRQNNRVRRTFWSHSTYRRGGIAFGVEKNKTKLILSTLLVVRLLDDMLKIHQNSSIKILLKYRFQWISPHSGKLLIFRSESRYYTLNNFALHDRFHILNGLGDVWV